MQLAISLVHDTRGTFPCSVRTIKSLVSNGSPAGETTRSGLSKLSFWHAFVHAIRRSSTHSDSITHALHALHARVLSRVARKQGRGQPPPSYRYFRLALLARSTKKHVYRRTILQGVTSLPMYCKVNIYGMKNFFIL